MLKQKVWVLVRFGLPMEAFDTEGEANALADRINKKQLGDVTVFNVTLTTSYP